MNPPPYPFPAICRLAAATVTAFAAMTSAETARAQDSGSPAQEPSVALIWIAPEQCPDERWVKAEVERLIGRPLVTAEGEPTIAVHGILEGTEKGGWVLRLRTVQAGNPGLRELEAEQCGTLAKAAALILALSIDPRAVEERRAERTRGDGGTPTDAPFAAAVEVGAGEAETRRSEPDGERVTETESEALEPEEQDEPETEVTTEGTSGPPLHLAFRIEALADAGTLPGMGAGMGAAVALLVERLRLEGSFGYWPEREGRIEEVPSLGAELGLLAGTAGICHRSWGELLSFSACAHIETGSLYGRGANVTRRLQGSALWLALLAGARAGWRVTRWGAFVLELGLAAPLLRPGYTLWVQGVTDRALVHRPATVAPRLRVGIELRI